MLDSAEDKEIKMLFIQEELKKFSKDLQKTFQDEIKKKKIIASGHLVSSFDNEIREDHGNPSTRFSFATYGRYIDIAAYKRKEPRNIDVWGTKVNRTDRSNRRKWYARNMYGSLGYLTRRIMYGLADTEIERLKGIIEERKNK